jgi:hypothetical protein
MEQEQIFFDACSPGAKMPYVEEMLDYLNDKGIRTDVISNFSISENAQTRLKTDIIRSGFASVKKLSALYRSPTWAAEFMR